MNVVSFNNPVLTGKFLRALAEEVDRPEGLPFVQRCETWLERALGAPRVLLTHSGTAALEMATLLASISWGDEVIMPSFTCASTANAVVLRGARPVFVDIDPATFNLDVKLVEAAITRQTRAIVPIHYAGVAAEMDALLEIAGRHGLAVIEDAAHGMFATSRRRPLGTMGNLGIVSFRETRNGTNAEGGALVINDPALVQAAEQIWEKGTDAARMRREASDRYTWQTAGSSFAPSEITAAVLWTRLQAGRATVRHRQRRWRCYHDAFAPLERTGFVRRPAAPPGSAHNGNLYRLLLPDQSTRDSAIERLAEAGVHTATHYVPLHGSPAGAWYGRAAGPLPVTEDVASRLIRLPLHAGVGDPEQKQVIEAVHRLQDAA